MHNVEFKKPEFKIFQEKFNFTPHVMGPSIIHTLPKSDVLNIATQASAMIHSLGEKTMFQPTPELLMDYMYAGLAIPVTKSYTVHELISFVKALPWFPNNPQPAEADVFKLIDDGKAPIALESGSLVVSPHYQKAHLAFDMKAAFAEYITDTFPGLPLFAVVTNTNTPSIENNYKSGWIPITHEESKTILKTDVLEGWDIPSTIFIYPNSLKNEL